MRGNKQKFASLINIDFCDGDQIKEGKSAPQEKGQKFLGTPMVAFLLTFKFYFTLM